MLEAGAICLRNFRILPRLRTHRFLPRGQLDSRGAASDGSGFREGGLSAGASQLDTDGVEPV